jgi:glycosyltransferase involved in cell wall biosynthesis
MGGVKYIGPIFDGSGYAEAARNYVLALHKQGYPVQVAPISFETTRPELGEDGRILQSLINNSTDYDKVIVHSTPDLWPNWIQSERGKYIIGYTVWETSALHPTWVKACNTVANEVWVPCDWNLEVFKESGVTKPLFKIPHAIDPPDLTQIPNFSLGGVGSDTFVFYSIFQWQERKNPYGLLAAYTAAFSGGEDVILILKTYRRDHGQDKEAIKNLVVDFRKFINLPAYPKLFLVVENMSTENMFALHKRADAFVLLQRSEGWGLPHFEAAACGNPVITPKYGGQTEFLKEDNSYLLDYTLTPVGGMSWSPYYTGNQYWCEPDMKQAVETLRYVYNNREEAREKGARARRYVEDHFTLELVCAKMLERLNVLDQGGLHV